MAGGSFWTMLRLAGFFSAVWFSGKVARFVGISSIVFEIGVGLLFAPGLLPKELLPRTYSVCAHDRTAVFNVETMISDMHCTLDGARRAMADAHWEHTPLFHMIDHLDKCQTEKVAWQTNNFTDTGSALADCMKKNCLEEVSHLCGGEPNIFSLIGHAGVALMIFESGMHFDFDGAKRVLPKATFVAVLGTFLPILAGMAITVWPCGYDAYPEGFAAGVALAPTSVGIALKLLLDAKVLEKDYGQLILSAAFVDDILSLIIFNILFAVTGPDGFQVVECVVFPAIGIIFMLTFGALGISFWPKVFHELEVRIRGEEKDKAERLFQMVIMTLMFVLLFGYGSFTMYLGTHLWGAFVAGMSFAGIHEAHHIWSHQTKRITSWMLRVFFSCTVAFAIPYESLFEIKSFAYGTIMGIVGALLTKILAGVCMGKPRFVIGWAMVGRAEFAYLIAEMAKSGGIIKDEMFAIIIWALLYATIIAPIAFKKVLQWYVIAEAKAEGENPEEAMAVVHSMSEKIAPSHHSFIHFSVRKQRKKVEKEKETRLRQSLELIAEKDHEITVLKRKSMQNGEQIQGLGDDGDVNGERERIDTIDTMGMQYTNVTTTTDCEVGITAAVSERHPMTQTVNDRGTSKVLAI